MQHFLSLPDVEFKKQSFATGTLGVRVASHLQQKIHADHLKPSTRLPSETFIAQHFKVSRSVVREAIALLKKDGILESRKGSGTFISENFRPNPVNDSELAEQSVHALLNLIEVRRGLESETAALAAIRRTPGQLAEIEDALRKIEEATIVGESGVEEDVRFHMLIAQATGNPYWVKFVDMLSNSLRSATRVTRANEDRRADFAQQVQEEHEQIVAAIEAGNPDVARLAASAHMIHAAERVKLADRNFWRGTGGELVRNIVASDLPVKKSSFHST